MPLINISNRTKKKLRLLKEVEELKSYDSAVRSLFDSKLKDYIVDMILEDEFINQILNKYEGNYVAQWKKYKFVPLTNLENPIICSYSFLYEFTQHLEEHGIKMEVTTL